MKTLFALTLLTLIISFSKGADTLTFEQAIKSRNVQFSAKANGGLGEDALRFVITNNLRRTQLIQMEPGMYLESENPDIQDLILFDDQMITLAPKEVKTIYFYGACTQLSNLSPRKDEAYQIGSADPILLEIAGIIARNDFLNSTAQAAVWAVTDNGPTQNLHNGDDIDVSWELATLIANHKNLQLPEKEQFFANPLPFRRIVYAARKDLAYHAPEAFKGTLGIYDGDGEMVKQYFEYKPYENGLHFYSMGINNIVEENITYIARLTDDKGTVLIEHTLDPNEAYVPAKEDILSINFEYAIRKRGDKYSSL